MRKSGFHFSVDVITVANHNDRKQRDEPIGTRSKYTSPVPSAGKRVRASHDLFWFYFSLAEKVAGVFLTNPGAK